MVDPNLFSSVTDNTLLPFEGGTLLDRSGNNDDNSQKFEINAVFENGFLFGGRTFNELFVSTNGGVSFIDQTINFAGTFENTNFIIAPFYDDLDGTVLPPGPNPGIYFDVNTDRDSVVVTWVGVGIFPSDITAPNTFQLEIMDLGGGDAELIYRFSDMGNSRGNSFQLGAVADGGPRVFLRGGTATDELGPAADIDELVGNTGVAGVWQFRVLDGELQPDDLLGDTVTGNANPNTINGTDRNDIISGGDGNDSIFGRLGIDRLNGDAGQDEIHGEGDDDILHGNADNDTLFGDEGDDTLFGDEGDDSLEGGSEIDVLDGGAGADFLRGDTGNQDFASYQSSTSGLTVNLTSPGSNTGDAVGDTYANIRNVIGSEFGDDITGTGSQNILRGGGGNDNIDGANGSDTLFGEDGDDTLIGEDGADELVGGAGADNLIGGASRDAASYRDAVTDVVADLQDTTSNSGEATGDSYSSIEDLIGGSENDRLSGNGTANDIQGLDGNDTLVGRDGNDTLSGDNEDDILNGGLGADRLEGGRAIDAATYVDATEGVRADLSNSGSNTGEAAGDTYSEIENLIGSGFNDTLVGDNQDNLLDGGAGNNTLIGNTGDDTLRSGAGEDNMVGGSGSDTADYSQSAAGVAASLNDSSTNAGEARGDTYSSIENLMGSEFGDTLGDNSSANMIMGLGGDDTINLLGGADTVDGGEGVDTASYATTTFVTIDLEDATQNGGQASGATFMNVENLIGSDTGADDLLGDSANNMLEGGGNADNLNGRGGDDTLRGGAGNDNLTVGAGADVIVLENGMGNDTVTDFDVNEDTLDFSRLTAAEQAAVTNTANGNGDRVVTLGDGSTLTMVGVPVNAAPTDVALSNTTTDIDENTDTTARIKVADITVTDDGIGTNTLALTGADAALFEIDGTELFLKAGTSLDFETKAQLDVSVTVDDTSVGNTPDDTVALSIAVNDVNEAPENTALSSNSVAENSPDRTVVGALSATDPDGDTVSFILDNDAGGLFDIFGGNLVVNGPIDFETATSHSVTVVTSDPNGLTDTATFTINVTDVEELAPTSGDDTLNGTNADDQIPAGDGNDSVNGGGGNDGVFGQDGNDTLNGGDGDDEVAGSTGDDVVNGDAGNDKMGGGPGNDTMNGGSGNDFMGGGQDDDSMNGGTGNDVVNGGPGNDTISGDDGNDTMGASFGNDSVDGGAGDDNLGGGTGRDTINGGDGNDSIGGGEGDDVITGGAGDDFLAGGGRDDQIDGGAGLDRINGGRGNDTVTGGDGADLFIFNSPEETDTSVDADVVTDFENGLDRFRLSGIEGSDNAAKLASLGITDTAGGALMNVDGGTILVENTLASAFGVEDFVFLL